MPNHRLPQQVPAGLGDRSRSRSAALLVGLLTVAVLQPVLAQKPAAAAPPAQMAATAEVAEPNRAASYIYRYIDTPTDRGNARAISDNRTVVGEYIETFDYKPFVYTPSGDTDDLPVGEGFTGGAATAISPDAQILGGVLWDVALDRCSVVRWLRQDDGTYAITRIVEGRKGSLAVGCSSEPTRITNAGRFDIQTADAEGGYTWQDGTLTRTSGQPLGPRKSGDGTYVKSKDGVSTQYNPDGTTLGLRPLPNPDGNPSTTAAAAITDYNEVVGWSAAGRTPEGALVDHAVRWNSDGSVVDLNDVTGYVGGNTEGVTLQTARGANLAGDIVGAAFNGARSGGRAAPMFLEVLPPVVFVPGVAGSRIIDASGAEKWLGIGKFHDGLALSGPEAEPGLRADKVLQHECLGPACPEVLRLYGPYVDALKARGMREYRTHTAGPDEPSSFVPGRMTTTGCDVTQRAANPNLFLFPYDWRQSNAQSAARLKDFMGCVRKFYTGPVILTAHSMGGLVSRRYLLDNPSYSNSVNHLVTMGTPWLGAPKSIHTLQTGDFGVPFVFNSTIKEILPTMFGPRQLIPSQAYYGLAPPPFVEDGHDLNGNGKSSETYTRDAVDDLLDMQYPASTAVTDDAAAFHAKPGQDDWTADTSQPMYTVIYGRQKVESTVGQVVATRRYVCRSTGGGSARNCEPRDTLKTVVTDGDGTVPVASAARRAAGRDLNKDDRQELIEVNPLDGYTDHQIEHVELPNNPKVIDTVARIAGRDSASRPIITQASSDDSLSDASLSEASLSDETVSDASVSHASMVSAGGDSGTSVGAPTVMGAAQFATATTGAGSGGWYVDVSGVRGSTTVVAPGGSTDAPLADTEVRPALPGVKRIPQGAGSELIVAPFTGADTYQVTFTSDDSPLVLDVRRGEQQAPDALARWNDVVVPANSKVTLTLAAGGTPSLSYTDPATGTATPIAATASVSGFYAQQSITPPTVSVGAIVLGGTRQYTLSAKPGLYAAVSQILWSVDGKSFRPYDGPIAVDPSVGRLLAIADDNAGNRSPLQVLDLASAPIRPVTTATTSPEVPANGYVAGPVTVRLKARASDGTTTRIVWNLSSPGRQTTYGVVDGDTATIPLSEDASYEVRYFSRDSAGNVEPERVLSVGVDGTAPSVNVATPARGSTPSALGAVTGSAGDDQSGLTRVEAALQRTSDSAYWNGTAWSATPVFHPAAGLDSWSLPGNLPKGEALLAGGYSVMARATDAAGNTGSAVNVFSISAHAQIRALDLPAGLTSSRLRTSGYAINASGQVAGDLDDPGNPPRPVRWDADGTATLLHAGSYSLANRGTVARGIDDAGTVSGRLPDSGVKWLMTGLPVRLTSKTGTYSINEFPLAANASGTVAGFSVGTWGTWPGSAFTALAVPLTFPLQGSEAGQNGGGMPYPMAINASGTVVGSRLVKTGFGEPLRTAAVMADAHQASFLFPPDTTWSSYAAGINDAGDIVGSGGAPQSAGTSAATPVPYLRSADGTVTRFPTAPKSRYGATAMDINNSGVIVGYAGPPWHPGVYEEGAWVIHRGVVKKLTDLLPADSGWVLNSAWAINDSGQIVGNGTLHGQLRGFVLTLGGLEQLATPPAVADLTAATPEGDAVTVPLQGDTTTTSPVTWSVVDQPASGTVTIDGGNAVYTPNPGFTGSDTFSVQADDGTMKSNVATVTVTVGSPAPAPPVALMAAPSSVVAGSRVQVDGVDSYDPAGGDLTYRWDLTGEGTFAGPDTAVAYLTPTDAGSHTVALKVTNAAGLSTVVKRTLTVVAAAAPPSTGVVAGSVNMSPREPTTKAKLTATPEGFSGGSGPLTYTYTWFNGSRQLAETSATLDLSVDGNGDRGDTVSVRVTATDGQNRSPEVTGKVQVANSAPTVALSRPSVDATYSDPLPDVGIAARDDDGDRLSLSGSGLPASVTVADSGNGTGTLTGTVTGGAGTSRATVSVSDGQLQGGAPLAVVVGRESATVEYTGPSLVSTGSPTAASAALALEARVSQEDDGTPGDLTKASVAFDLFASQNTSGIPDRTVVAPVGADGLAAASVPDIGTDSWSVVARIPAGNVFFRAAASDPSLVIVYQPEPGAFAAGGGWVKDPRYLDKPVAVSSSNDHGNFGFNVRYRRDGKPMGQLVYVFRGSDGYTYTVKSNSWAGGQFAVRGTGAAFSAQATVTVSDPATGLAVPGLGGGGFTFRADVTDGTPSGAPDRFALTVTAAGGALYHRAGTATQQLELGGGSIVLQR